MPAPGRAADAPVPKAELLDIVGRWIARMPPRPPSTRPGARPPGGSRPPLDDRRRRDRGIRGGFHRRPVGRRAPGARTGHCIDFHLPARAFQLQQLAFRARMHGSGESSRRNIRPPLPFRRNGRQNGPRDLFDLTTVIQATVINSSGRCAAAGIRQRVVAFAVPRPRPAV